MCYKFDIIKNQAQQNNIDKLNFLDIQKFLNCANEPTKKESNCYLSINY